MKNRLMLIAVITLSISTISTTLFAQSQGKNEFIWKVGGGHASDIEKWGLDMSFNYMYNLDPIFVFGFEGDFFWTKAVQTKTTIDPITTIPEDRTSKADVYTFPFYFNGQLRFPFFGDRIYPAATLGLGYAFTFFSSTADTGKGAYGGMTLQGLGSLYFKIIDVSNAYFVFDAGYRHLPQSRNGKKVNMSGAIVRLGVKVFL